jgi:AraC family transcriptional regulator
MTTLARTLTTAEAHHRAVAEVVRYMRVNLLAWDANLSLEALARKGGYSKSHLIEIFEEVTGTTPHLFLASLRIQKAKELLLTSTDSVTQIAFAVGYESFPTFSRTFTDYVGLPPSEFRRTPCTFEPAALLASVMAFTNRNKPQANNDSITGIIRAPTDEPGLTFIGTFTRGIPQGRPFSGSVIFESGPGHFCIPRPSGPAFHLLAARLPTYGLGLAHAHAILPVLVASRKIEQPTQALIELDLRPLRPTDPPLVVSLAGLLGPNRGVDDIENRNQG